MSGVWGYTDLNVPVGPKCQEVCEAAVKCKFVSKLHQLSTKLGILLK